MDHVIVGVERVPARQPRQARPGPATTQRDDEDHVVAIDADGVVHNEARDEQELLRKKTRTADMNDSPSD